MTDTMNTIMKEETMNGYCYGCGRHCPLSDPHCPTGMEKAGWTQEQIEAAKAARGDHDGEGRKHRGERGGHRHPDEDVSEEDRLLHSLLRCGNHLRHGRDRHSSQDQLLALLSAAGGSAVQSELAQKLDVRRASISELLSKMERKGLLTREPSAEDRRQLVVSLTGEGQEALAGTGPFSGRPSHEHDGPRRGEHGGPGHRGPSRPEDTAALFSALTDEEKQQLLTLLDKLLRSWREQRR